MSGYKMVNGEDELIMAVIVAVLFGVLGYWAAWEFVGLTHFQQWLTFSQIEYLVGKHGILPLSFPAVSCGAAVCLIFGGIVGFWLGWLWSPNSENHIRGRRLLPAKQAAKALRPRRSEAQGIFIHPRSQISQPRECRHILLLGGSGSGKTTILWPIIQQAIARGDKCLIFSFKGDFQERLPEPLSLLAPWDQRSSQWQLGADIRTRLDAEALASTLVPTPEREPQWAQGAQGLLTAIISDVQARYGQAWGFAELAQGIAQALGHYDHLVSLVMEHSPVAKAFLMGRDSKTTGSYLAMMATRLVHVVNLGVAQWASPQPKTWSVRDWLAGKSPTSAILGYSSAGADLSAAFGASILEQVLRQVLDMPDCPPDARRIWLFLDEVPQLGKVPSITQALEAGRSKGVRVVLGMQGSRQLKEHGYSQETMDIWAGQTGTKIITSLSAPADQKWASDLLGDREVNRWQQQTAIQAGKSSTQTGGYQRVREPVLLPASLGTDLYVGKNGPRGLLLTQEAAAILAWPFPKLQNRRPDKVPASWTRPGFVRPVWGKVPPPVAEHNSGSGGIDADASARHAAPVADSQEPGQHIEAGKEQPMPVQQADGLTDGLVDTALEHMLDAVAPGLGMLDQILSGSDEIGNGSAAALTTMPRPAQNGREEDQADQDQAPENG